MKNYLPRSLIRDGKSTLEDGAWKELSMQLRANEEFALSSAELLCLCYSGFPESSLAGGQVLTALFICTDSWVLREQRGGVAAEGPSNRFEWSGWLVPQFAVSFLARLCWVASTGTVKCGRGVGKGLSSVLASSISFIFNLDGSVRCPTSCSMLCIVSWFVLKVKIKFFFKT